MSALKTMISAFAAAAASASFLSCPDPMRVAGFGFAILNRTDDSGCTKTAAVKLRNSLSSIFCKASRRRSSALKRLCSAPFCGTRMSVKTKTARCGLSSVCKGAGFILYPVPCPKRLFFPPLDTGRNTLPHAYLRTASAHTSSYSLLPAAKAPVSMSMTSRAGWISASS